ncbi:hypothetical protein GGR50DRAFT_699046 [Xylaria sp. CBS 124048]|nr:hypothetical protein GGR50DRAFT_699046 [Xylaria sp. CBS 124048]
MPSPIIPTPEVVGPQQDKNPDIDDINEGSAQGWGQDVSDDESDNESDDDGSDSDDHETEPTFEVLRVGLYSMEIEIRSKAVSSYITLLQDKIDTKGAKLPVFITQQPPDAYSSGLWPTIEANLQALDRHQRHVCNETINATQDIVRKVMRDAIVKGPIEGFVNCYCRMIARDLTQIIDSAIFKIDDVQTDQMQIQNDTISVMKLQIKELREQVEQLSQQVRELKCKDEHKEEHDNEHPHIHDVSIVTRSADAQEQPSVVTRSADAQEQSHVKNQPDKGNTDGPILTDGHDHSASASNKRRQAEEMGPREMPPQKRFRRFWPW